MSQVSRAERFIYRELSAGPRTANEMLAAAAKAEIGKRTLMRAKAAMGVESRGPGSAREWSWRLPSGVDFRQYLTNEPTEESMGQRTEADSNSQFRQWSRSSTFNISLNESAIKQLVYMLCCEDYRRSLNEDPEEYGDQIFERNRVNYLMKRGLIQRCRPTYSDGVAKEGYENIYRLTEAGTHTARLLNCAGFLAPEYLRERVAR